MTTADLQPRADAVETRRCCLIGSDDELWQLVWAAYAHGNTKTRDREVGEILAKHGSPLTLSEVHRHMHYHRPVQPSDDKRLSQQKIDALVSELTENEAAVLQHVARFGITTIRATANTAFSHVKPAARESAAGQVLLRLCRRGLLANPRAMECVGDNHPRVGWLLTTRGVRVAELLDQHDGSSGLRLKARNFKKDYGASLRHDLTRAELMASLSLDARTNATRRLATTRGEHTIKLVSNTANLFGEPHLKMGHQVPAYYLNGIRSGGDGQNLAPDGFIGLGLEDDATSVVTGLFIEFDSGASTSPAEAAKQLWEYVGLAYSGAPVKRLPHFGAAAESGYFIPVLMTTQDGRRRTRRASLSEEQRQGIDERRQLAIAKEFLHLVAAVRWEDPLVRTRPLPPIYIAVHDEVIRAGLGASVVALHRVAEARATQPDSPMRKQSLLTSLLRDASHLQRGGVDLPADTVLRIESKAALGLHVRDLKLTAEQKQRLAELAEDRERHMAALRTHNTRTHDEQH